jgi:hypothetical protein
MCSKYVMVNRFRECAANTAGEDKVSYDGFCCFAAGQALVSVGKSESVTNCLLVRRHVPRSFLVP